MPIGFRVFTKRELPPKELINAFKHIPVANIADCMGRLSAMSSQIRRMSAPSAENMTGAALTVKARPGDNLMIHKALNMVEPGDIVVVSNGGDRSQSLIGEIMLTYGKCRGLAGMVLDGPMRDVESIYGMGVPMYAAGSTPGGPYKEGPGEVNVPIACGGIHVDPGDIIVGDGDGVIVIPKNDAEHILEEAKKFNINDRMKLKAAADGSVDRSWVEKSLLAKGCEIFEEAYR